jgi:hypothetical protein
LKQLSNIYYEWIIVGFYNITKKQG